MEGGEGMVAVVRGLRDAGLAVTLLDAGKQYTLVPNAAPDRPTSSPLHTPKHCVSQQCSPSDLVVNNLHCHSGLQVTDGRYASIYKMAHCNLTPTSPPVQLTEFPPQRAELCPGFGNFEVGGSGSGETGYSPTRANGLFRGAMSWSDRGSVCTPRPSREPNAFANSLRKYPNISPDRSSEIVEQLISYTQTKNVPKSYHSRTLSPVRNHINMDTVMMERPALRNSFPRRDRNPQRNCYESEVNINRMKRGIEESPTRDWRVRRQNECDNPESYRQPIFSNNYDVRYLKDVSRRVKDNMKNIASNSYTQPVCPVTRERYDMEPLEQLKYEKSSTNTMNNMEIQAVATMVSKKVATEPLRRSVAVPLSPSPSTVRCSEGAVSSRRISSAPGVDPKQSYKSVQTTVYPINLTKKRKSVQTTLSSLELPNPTQCPNLRRSRSYDQMNNNDMEAKFLEWLSDSKTRPLQEGELKWLSCKLRKLTEKFDRSEGNKIRIKIGNCLKNATYQCPDCKGNHLLFKQQFSDEIKSKVERLYRTEVASPFELFRVEISPYLTPHNLEIVIKDWLRSVPLKNRDVLGRAIKREQLFNDVFNKLKQTVFNRKCLMKSDIIKVLEKLPVDIITRRSKLMNFNRLADSLINRLQNVVKDDYRTKIMSKNNDFFLSNNEPGILFGGFKSYIQPTERELKKFITNDLIDFLNELNLEFNPKSIGEIEMELVDILMDSMEALKFGEDDRVKEEIVVILCDVGGLLEHQALRFAELLLEHMKEKFDTFNGQQFNGTCRSETYIILQNTSQSVYKNQSSMLNTLNKSSDFSISGVSEGDIQANLDIYMNRLSKEIDDWLTSLHINISEAHEQGFRQVVVNDLAGDIIDRHKYLELNPSSRGSDEEELENLKYQIFKWINKLVGEDNKETIAHASDLMQKIQSIPVPMLTKPHENAQDEMKCCKGQGNLSQKPSFGPSGPSGSITDYRRQDVADGKCFNGSGSSSSRYFKEDRAKQIPTFIPAEPGVNKSKYPQQGAAAAVRRYSTPAALTHKNITTNDGTNTRPTSKCDASHDRSMNINQMPTFGPSGPGGSMIESSAQCSPTAPRRLSGPSSMASGPTRGCVTFQDGSTNTSQPISAPVSPGSSKTESSAQCLSTAARHRFGSMAHGAMTECGACSGGAITINQMPMFDPAGPGGNMIESPTQSPSTAVRRFSAPGSMTSGPIIENNVPMFGSSDPGGSMTEKPRCTTSNRKLSDPGKFDLERVFKIGSNSQCCKPNNQSPDDGDTSVQRLHDELEQYIKNWVLELPLPDNTPKEQAVADKTRLDFINGVWAAIAKIGCMPAANRNSFFFADLFDDELERLFSSLPQTEEILSKKELLKEKLIERATNTKDRLNETQASAFKEQLVQNVSNQIPKRTIGINIDIEEEDPQKIHEDMNILYLVEDYILSTSYKEEDPFKANVYRNKLLKRVQAFVDELKKTHERSLQDIDRNTYVKELMDALQNVPLPRDDTLKKEADEILLGVEVEQWFIDVPLEINEEDEQLQRRRVRDVLTKKLLTIEKETNFSDTAGDDALYHEISKFLDKMPLRENDHMKKKFMIDELRNRIKNRPRVLVTPPNKRKVMFKSPVQERFNKSEGQLNQSKSSGTSCSGVGAATSENWFDHLQPKDRPPPRPPVVRPLMPGSPGMQLQQEIPHYDNFDADKPACSSFGRPQDEQESIKWLTLVDSQETPRESCCKTAKQSNVANNNSPLSSHFDPYQVGQEIQEEYLGGQLDFTKGHVQPRSPIHGGFTESLIQEDNVTGNHTPAPVCCSPQNAGAINPRSSIQAVEQNSRARYSPKTAQRLASPRADPANSPRTPQCTSTSQNPPRAPVKRKKRGTRKDDARKCLDFNDEEESDNEGYIRCCCFERSMNRKKRNRNFFCDGAGVGLCPRFFPMGCPYPYFF